MKKEWKNISNDELRVSMLMKNRVSEQGQSAVVESRESRRTGDAHLLYLNGGLKHMLSTQGCIEQERNRLEGLFCFVGRRWYIQHNTVGKSFTNSAASVAVKLNLVSEIQ